MIKTALSHEVLDQFSRNKVHINLHTVYFLVIAKAKVWRYLFGVITPVQKVGIKSGGWISLLVSTTNQSNSTINWFQDARRLARPTSVTKSLVLFVDHAIDLPTAGHVLSDHAHN